ncbi:hypothetical protein IPL68_05930 [Candidatus Saccharibacteria bacterium]|nr:MAG: hypothetical protein IPL68_05930 [Candidatus Saccharibacteria bacterium]
MVPVLHWEVANRFWKPLDIPGHGSFAGLEKMLFVMARLGRLTADNTGIVDELGISEDRTAACLSASDYVSGLVVSENIKRLDVMKNGHPELAELLGNDPSKNLFALANINADYAHSGQERF